MEDDIRMDGIVLVQGDVNGYASVMAGELVSVSLSLAVSSV
jgi:hypothetical protein